MKISRPTKIKRIIFLDFDACLVHDINSEQALTAWELKHECKHPNNGWFNSPESLDLELNSIQRNENVYNDFTMRSDSNTLTVLLTNRPTALELEVLNALNHLNVHLHELTFKSYPKELKSTRIAKFIVDYPDVKEIVFYDDLYGHFLDCQPLVEEYLKIDFNFILVQNETLMAV
ncbi:hypothetical protein [Pedobacter sp. FW305-3-2-15-E-R2A2]|uniref:hypothetical protein n=1 Tax=Pedobacter sp. FW305-3-2-15-E-R2A2 TaxID=3140251 RepID=UPI003140647A